MFFILVYLDDFIKEETKTHDQKNLKKKTRNIHHDQLSRFRAYKDPKRESNQCKHDQTQNPFE